MWHNISMLILQFLLVFAISSFVGFIIETIYRSVHEKEIIKPGFLNGPYLPIYGTSSLVFFIVAGLPIDLYFKLFILLVIPTLMELVVGFYFLKKYEMRLWDYTEDFLNYKGIIALKYSFYWAVLALLFYYFIFPQFNRLIDILNINLVYYFFLGIFVGVFSVDVIASFSLANKVKLFLQEFNKNRFDKKILDYRGFKRRWKRFMKRSMFVNFFERNFLPLSGNTIRDLFTQLEKFTKRKKTKKKKAR